MVPLNSLLGRASSLAGERTELGPSLGLEEALFRELPSDTTALAGGDAEELARRPEILDWLRNAAGWLSGRADALDRPPLVRGNVALWALLADGEPGFDPAVLTSAVPRGAAWVVAVRPDAFFEQAAAGHEQSGTERGARWAARLRSPAGNLDIVRRNVETVALSLDSSDTPSLRLRIGCVDATAALQGVVLLTTWRLRRSIGESPAADAFRRAEVRREGARVELRVAAPLEGLIGLFAPG